MNSDLNKQAQALEVKFSMKTKSRRNQFQQFIKNLPEWEIEFLYHIKEGNAQMRIRSENLFY